MIATELRYIHMAAKEKKTGEKSPVLVLLHGLGANEKDLAIFGASLDRRLEVYSLRGPINQGPDHHAWFHIAYTESGALHNQREAESSLKTLIQFLKDLRQQPEVDSEKVFILGFSQGTIMSLAAALTEPDLLTGVIAIAGRAPQDDLVVSKKSPLKKRPDIFILHGTEDKVLPLFHAEAAELTLKNAGFAVEFKKYDAAHAINVEIKKDIRAWLKSKL